MIVRGRAALVPLVALSMLGLAVVAAPASAIGGVTQTSIVSDVPGTNSPNINNGQTFAIMQIGTRMIIGGSFSSVSPPGVTNGGSALSRPNVLAFSAATGAVDTGFVPAVDGTVWDAWPGPSPDTVYISGAFNNVNGVKAKGVALLSTINGQMVAGFKPAVLNGTVYAVRPSGGHLFIGGQFTTVGGVAHAGIATLNPTTGALDPYMNIQLTGHHNDSGSGSQGGVGARKFALAPDGSRLIVIGNFKNANAALHDQIVNVLINGGSAAIDPSWNTLAYTAYCFNGSFDTYVQDVDFSPDGSYFVVAATGGSGTNVDGTNSLCDTAARWNTADTGSNVRPVWADYSGQDTIASVAVTGTAVYIGGHERWLNNPHGFDFPGPGAVPRPGLGALDPVSGVPLNWNPGRNPRGIGAASLLATSTGLWVGSDTSHIGNRKYFRGRIAFFPLAGGAPAPNYTTAQLPSNLYLTGSLPKSNVLYRVNAGGGSVAALDGGPAWQGDDSDPSAYRNSGSNAAGWDHVAAVDSTVPATTPSAIFDSERWDPGSNGDGQELHWGFPVPAGTSVTVRLYFANRCGCTSGVGQRVFDVALDGTTVLPSFDMVAAAGDQTGTMRSFPVTSDGTVDIDLTHETENPLINGIEIIDNTPPPTPYLYRVNAGGGTVQSVDGGPNWQDDTSDPVSYRNSGSNTAGWSPVAHVDSTVPASTPSGIFDSERWDPGSNGDGQELHWNFPVAAGTPLTVRLYFANRCGCTSGVGQRVFDVALDGTTVLDHFDMVAAAGDQTGTMRSYDITSDGVVNIDLTHETENPLINGIEIVNRNIPDPGAGSTNTLLRRAFTGTGAGGSTSLTGTGISWGSVRGAFMVGNKLFYGYTDGNLYVTTFDGTTFGTPKQVDPYEDPAWANVDTGSGQTYLGVKPSFYGSEMQNITSMFYSGGHVYYTLSGQGNLFSRSFSPDSGIVTEDENQTGGVDLSNVAGGFLAGSTYYYASRVDGTLHSVTFSGGALVGGTDQVLTGPGIDGVDWRARGMFLFGGSVAQPTASFTSSCTLLVCSFDATASTPASGLTYAWTFGDGGVASGATPQHTYLAAGPRTVTLTVTDTLNQTASVNHLANPNLGPPPTAAFTPTCTLLSCSFNASASTGPSGGITSYAWDFGDGSTGTGVTTSHSYAAGTFTVSLTVTDGVGQTSTVTHQVSPASNAVAFVTSVKSNAKAATQTLTVPTSVASGNGMLLVATTASAAVPTAPGGWTLVGTSTATGSVLTTAVYQKVATIADPGSSVAVGFGSSVVGSVQLLVYSGTSATNPVASFVTASNRTSQTTEVTPTTSIGSPAWVVSLWQVKTSLPTTGTNFTTPVGQTVRSATTFTGGGHTAALATDGGAPAAAGTVGGLSTTLDGAAGAATTWTIVLAAA